MTLDKPTNFLEPEDRSQQMAALQASAIAKDQAEQDKIEKIEQQEEAEAHEEAHGAYDKFD